MQRFFLPLFFAPLALLAADEPIPAFHAEIERLVPAFDQIIPHEAHIDKLAEGFNWSEGPTWFKGSVVFSDVPENIIYQWKPGATRAAIFLKPSGMLTPHEGFREQGSNGLAVDADGRLLICQHGERRVARLNPDNSQSALADKFEGKRFSSPNDLALRKNGEIYFTDPPYGLDKLNASPLKEIPWNGVYRIARDGTVSLLVKDLTFPNGIAFSPDEKILYVAVSDAAKPHIMAYEVQNDGSVANGRVFFDATPLQSAKRKGSCDGLKVDAKGNLFATGPGGVLILSPKGEHLGTLLTNQATGNCCFGGADGSELFITADMFLCRVKTATRGAGF
jgi:gluconolactonase